MPIVSLDISSGRFNPSVYNKRPPGLDLLISREHHQGVLGPDRFFIRGVAMGIRRRSASVFICILLAGLVPKTPSGNIGAPSAGEVMAI
jgi:hypothetical protein